jgi:hypothetical protein
MMRLIVFILISAMQIMLATDDPAKRGAATQEIPRIKEIRVEKIGALTGPTSPNGEKSADVCSTDLGTMTEVEHKIYFAFGDTFGYLGNDPKPLSGVDWRSNVFASAATGVAPEKAGDREIPRLTWRTDATGKAVSIIAGAHQPAFMGSDGEQTKIPTAMVSVGSRIYLHYMSVHGFAPRGGVWECNYSKFIYSDDFGKNWTPLETPFGDRNSNFNMLAITNQRGSGNVDGAYVYALGTPCGRFGGVQAARVPAQKIQNFGAWEYYSGAANGETGWARDQAKAIDIIPPPVGEASILWNPLIKRWMYTYLNESTATIELREAENPWGPWSIPNIMTNRARLSTVVRGFHDPVLHEGRRKDVLFRHVDVRPVQYVPHESDIGAGMMP